MGARSMVRRARQVAKSWKKMGRWIASMDMAFMVTAYDFWASMKSISMLERSSGFGRVISFSFSSILMSSILMSLSVSISLL